MSYAVKLDIFEGPLDLLLQLVSRERVDVTEICVADVTEEFVRTMKEIGEVDLETASSFLVLAATLLELKSLKLLPNRNALADAEMKLLLEERDRLLHRLIVYATFKQAAGRMGAMLGQNAGFHSRRAELPPELVPKTPQVLKGVTPTALAAAASTAFASTERPAVDVSHVTPVTVNLAEMVERLRSEIRLAGTSSFRTICRSAAARLDVVVSFLALLELFKAQAIELEQPEPFGEIEVTWAEQRAATS